MFDMDGVLIDSEPLHFEATRVVLERHGIPYTEAVHGEFLGMAFRDAYRTLQARHGSAVDAAEVSRQRMDALVPVIQQRAVPMDGVPEALESLRRAGYRVALASSSSPEMIRVKLDVLGLTSRFEVAISGLDVARGKPAPDVFVEAARRLGVAPERCLAIEDSRHGMLAARAAGMCCVVVPCAATRDQDFTEANTVAARLADVLALLDVASSTDAELMSAGTNAFDYDQGDIHRTYASGRALAPEQISLWAAILGEELAGAEVRRVIDLGCGVGRFSAMLRSVFGAPVFGIDRSERMLAAAIANPAARGTRWIRACAEALPVRDAGVDLVFLFLVYHHFADRHAALRECARVLAPGATLLIVTSTAETLDSYRWLPFFPSARGIDLARLPSRAGLTEAARDAGLALRRHRTVMNPVAPDLCAYANRIASRTISTLQLVSDEEFARGIAELRRQSAQEDRGQPVADEIDVFCFRPELSAR